ncbi:MAG TPA: ribonuclease HI family protein [Terriglobales bacterium]|nr:ribonuclease HI family protein [Terriglobales bacterium]
MTPRPSQSQELFGARLERLPEAYLVAHVDGGARGNPGPAGFGVVIEDEAGRPVARLSQYLGHRTNNYAEYMGLLSALAYALKHGFKALKVISDSELMVRQIQGKYKVKSPVLLDLYKHAKSLIQQLDWFRIEHTLREGNAEADRLANEAMDQGMRRPSPGQMREQATSTSTPVPPASPREVEGVVREGRVEFTGATLPEGTKVKIRTA